MDGEPVFPGLILLALAGWGVVVQWLLIGRLVLATPAVSISAAAVPPASNETSKPSFPGDEGSMGGPYAGDFDTDTSLRDAA